MPSFNIPKIGSCMYCQKPTIPTISEWETCHQHPLFVQFKHDTNKLEFTARISDSKNKKYAIFNDICIKDFSKNLCYLFLITPNNLVGTDIILPPKFLFNNSLSQIESLANRYYNLSAFL